MAFKYKLETLLKLRERDEEKAQHKLAREIFVLENHRLLLGRLHKGRLELIRDFEEKKKTTMTAIAYKFFGDSLQTFDRQIEFQVNAVKNQELIVERVRSELEAKSRARQIVERMKEKEYVEYVREIVRKEGKEHDDLSVLRFRQGRRL